MEKLRSLETILRAAPVVPVIVVNDAASAVPLARALVRGGLPAIEITLRTEAAFEAARRVRGEVEGAFLGLGTVLHRSHIAFAEEVGAHFMVSPGSSPGLLDAADDSAIPLLPGAATVTEAMILLERGYTFQKFFPAGPAGGPAYLAALFSPLPAVRFCPTGGVGEANAGDYLRLGNVVCVGGSWVAPSAAIAAGDFATVERLASAAAALKRGA